MSKSQERSPQQVLVLGHFGGLNVGDDLMLDGFLSSWPVSLARLVVVAKDPRYVPVGGRSRVEVIPMSARAVWNAARRSDALVVVGGAHFHDDYELRRYMRHARYLLRYLALFALARVRRVPVALISQGIGPLRRASARWMAMLALRLATAVTVRDRSSVNVARRLTGRRPHVSFDLAGLAALPVDRFPRSSSGGDAMTLAISFLDFSQIPSITRSTEEIAALIADGCALLREREIPLRVRLLGLRGGDREHDAPALSLLHERLGARGMESQMEIYEGDLRAFLERFAQADAHVACRLHSAILAYLLDLPFAALVYHEKVRAFASDTGLRPECVLDPDAFATEDFATSVEAVLGQPAGETRAPRDVGSDAAAHVNAVAELISGPEGRARPRSPLGRRARS